MLVVFIEAFSNRSSLKILSTIARLSGGTYDELPDIVRKWRKFYGAARRLEDPFGSKEELELVNRYLTPMLLCGKPDSVDIRRWFLKCLSNDQTAFTGFTSLVDVVKSEQTGYDGQIRLLPAASFVEPFVLRALNDDKQKRLIQIQESISRLDVTNLDEINRLLDEAEKLYPFIENRKKGKSPIFFYGVSDKPFQLPKRLYERLEKIARLVYSVLDAATKEWSVRCNEPLQRRNILTGSIDFMVYDDRVYVIDIGAPAVGYIADIIASSRVLSRKPQTSVGILAGSIGRNITLPKSRLAEDLGFFRLERDYLVETLKTFAVCVEESQQDNYEAVINGEILPSKLFDYLTRNQPIRNQILSQIMSKLSKLGAEVPAGIICSPDDNMLPSFFDKTRLGEDLGIVIKKKVLFKEYETGVGYFKPLVVPLWTRESRTDRQRSVLFEQFVPSLVETDIAGDRKGKRCYEIRMYFTAGDSND